MTDQLAATIDAAVKDVGVPVLVGAVLDGPADKVRNAGIVWDPVSGPGRMYVKRHPVPFGEYMPYRSLVRRISKKVDLVPRDFAAGREPGALTVGPARIADVICFEVAYDGVVRDAVRAGGRLLVVQTNNATFGRSGETYQQLAMGRLRAVEHGRRLVVLGAVAILAIAGAAAFNGNGVTPVAANTAAGAAPLNGRLARRPATCSDQRSASALTRSSPPSGSPSR